MFVTEVGSPLLPPKFILNSFQDEDLKELSPVSFVGKSVSNSDDSSSSNSNTSDSTQASKSHIINSDLAPASSAIAVVCAITLSTTSLSASINDLDNLRISSLCVGERKVHVLALLKAFNIPCGTPAVFCAVANSDSLTTEFGSSIFIYANIRATSATHVSKFCTLVDFCIL